MARKIERECYVDTSALIAFLDRSDSYHRLFHRLFSTPPPLAASSLVIAEGHGWFLRRYDARRAAQFLAFVRELPKFAICPFDTAAVTSAGRVFTRFLDQKLTLADAHGLAVMSERRIETCWSTDRHLGLTGVSLVI
jgi:predicted nucleic acid-binding protein